MNAASVFDAELIETVAEQSGLDPARLRTLLETHQRSIREMTGVDTLVYDLRKYHSPDPLHERTDDAYFLVVPTDFWGDVADLLSLSDAEATTLRQLHERRVRQALGSTDHDGADAGEPPLADGQAVVLIRE